MRKYRNAIIWSVIIGTLGGLTAIGMFALSGIMLSKSAFDVPLYTLTILVATIKLFGVIRAVTRYFERLISHEATFDYLKELRINVVTRLMDSFVTLHSRYKMSELLTQTVTNVEKMQNVILRVIYPPLVVMMTSLIVIVVFLNTDWKSAIVILTVMILILLIVPLWTGNMMKQRVMSVESKAGLWHEQLHDYHMGLQEINVFDKEHRFIQQLTTTQQLYEEALIKQKKLLIGYDLLLNIFSMLAIFGVLYIFDGQTMLYASFVMVTITLFEMAVPMTNFPYYYQDTRRAKTQLESIQKAEVRKGLKVNPLPISMNDLNFKFAEQYALKDINFSLNAGDKIAVVGESGSGKSTFLSLLTGLYESDIQIDGHRLPQINIEHHFSQLNVMIQNNHFIEGTVQENMFSADSEEIAYWLNYFDLQLKSDTYLSQFGATLSGGEKKRLHFIRLCMRKQPLWLLDEPFNGVDIYNKQKMLATLLSEPERTVVMISHELSILKPFHRILLIHNGQIIESGTFEELIASKGEFYRRLMLEQDQL